MKTFHALSISGAVALIVLASACGSERPGSGTEGRAAGEGAGALPAAVDGLRVVEMDEASGKLVLTYSKGDHTLTYDMRLGPKMAIPPTASELAENPELTTYQIDAQVLDGEGQPFRMQMGGDGFIDASWTMPHVEKLNEASRVKDFELLEAAVPAFRALKLPAGLDQLRLTGIQIGLGVRNEMSAKPDAVPATTDTSGIGGALRPQGDVALGPSSVVKWDFVIRNKDQGAGIIGNHTGVILRGWSSSSIVFTAMSCNHGTCPNSDRMRVHCTMPGYLNDDGTHSRYFQSSGCTTKFDWDSTSVLGGAHNCNDDTELQLKAIYADSRQCTTCGSCSSLGFHNYSPGCARP